MKTRNHWTKERCAEEALKYPTRRQFQKGCQSAYQKAYKEHWLDEICTHMKTVGKPCGYWTKEMCAVEARKHRTRMDFQQANPSAYNKANQEGWLDEICSHIRIISKNNKEWTNETCRMEALKYKTRTDFKRKSPSAYYKAKREGWLEEICSHMKSRTLWTKEECKRVALRYSAKPLFREQNPSAFNAAERNGWLEEICGHMRNRRKFNTVKQYKNMEEIKKSDLKGWVIDYITRTIHSAQSDDKDFNDWANSFSQEEAETFVNMEYVADWGDDEREKIPIDEVHQYAVSMLNTILSRWNIH